MKTRQLTTMKRILFFSMTILMLIPFIVNTTFAAEPALTPFKIVYAVKYSVGKGKMTLALSNGEMDGYNLESEVVAEGLAKLVMSDPVSQHATFVITDNAVQATSYSLSDGTEKNELGGRIEYDWDASQASLYSSEEGDSVLPLAPGTMDDLVMQAAAALEVKLGKKEFSFLELQPGKKLRTHNFKYVDEETIRTKIGEIKTIKYSQNREGSSRTTFIWFSTEHDYVPIELQRVKDGKTIFTGKLLSLTQ